MNTAIRRSVVILVSAWLSGCGVAHSTSALIDAKHEYEAATLVDAEARAPYEFTLGVEYLRKAREEAGYSDYQVAEKLARRAQMWLEEARRIALVEGTAEKPVLEPTLKE